MGGVEQKAGLQVTPTVRLVRPLGRGGMGAVWIAEHLTLRAQVVVKFMSDELARRADAVERFSREASAAFSVRHPHVVQMLDHGVTDGTPFIVMELLEGEDLSKRIARGALPPVEVVRIVAQTGKALDRMHERGVVHRDIKPENIFLCDVGETFVKVLDFGIAKQADAIGGTQTGAMIGTPHYMSPEQMSGSKQLDGRTDLWSLAVVAFQALTGKRPFDGETFGQVAVAVNVDDIPSVRAFNPQLPFAIDAWFWRACARNPQERFATARKMTEALEAALLPSAPRTQYAEPTPLPTSSAPRTEPVVIIATPPPVQVQSAPRAYIPHYVEEDDEEDEPRSLRWVFWLLFTLLLIGGGVWLYLNPWAIDQATEMLRG